MNKTSAPDLPDEEFEKIWIEAPVFIPTLDGKNIAETINHRVQALKSRKTGEIYFDGHALGELDKVKARHMGLLTPEQIKELREHLDLTQKEISELLQIGEKTWTRWETGRERPSRSLNLLLQSILDGKIDVVYLKSRRPDCRTTDIAA
ncbi:MAG: helix-turn-helix domain-containing protein [Methylacidiphilales bacterium]|nr:helix-turn-helix domain-containing protein [Candidatus Methylacidiphilales bacterium]